MFDDEGYESIGDAPVLAEESLQVPHSEDLIDIDEDTVTQPAKPFPEPKIPTAAEIEAHNVTHCPYRSWCKYCVSARRKNSQHLTKSPSSHRSVPLLVADYCFVRDSQDKNIATVLVACLYPARLMLATVVPCKGPDQSIALRLASFL